MNSTTLNGVHFIAGQEQAGSFYVSFMYIYLHIYRDHML